MDARKNNKFSQEGATYRGVAISLANGSHIVAAMESPIPTTFAHEAVFHATIEPVLETDPEARQAFIDEYNDTFGDNATEWNRDVSEWAARVYEAYLTNGRKLTAKDVKDPSRRSKLQTMFDTFTEMMKEFYNKVLEYNNSKGVTKPIKVSKQSQAYFDRITFKPETKKDMKEAYINRVNSGVSSAQAVLQLSNETGKSPVEIYKKLDISPQKPNIPQNTIFEAHESGYPMVRLNEEGTAEILAQEFGGYVDGKTIVFTELKGLKDMSKQMEQWIEINEEVDKLPCKL